MVLELCFITLHNRLKMSEYEVYWLTDFALINSWAPRKNYNLSFEVVCTSYKQVAGKISNFTVNKDHSNKK